MSQVADREHAAPLVILPEERQAQRSHVGAYPIPELVKAGWLKHLRGQHQQRQQGQGKVDAMRTGQGRGSKGGQADVCSQGKSQL